MSEAPVDVLDFLREQFAQLDARLDRIEGKLEQLVDLTNSALSGRRSRPTKPGGAIAYGEAINAHRAGEIDSVELSRRLRPLPPALPP